MHQYHDIFSKSSIGFDRMLTLFDELSTLQKTAVGYPPYNIKRLNDTEIMVEVAVAGFNKDEIEIIVENGELTVSGQKKVDEKVAYLYKGIADRTFIRKYKLADTIHVKNASILDGVLCILLENIIPEDKKPRKISISEIPLDFKKNQELLLEEQKAKELAEATAERL